MANRELEVTLRLNPKVDSGGLRAKAEEASRIFTQRVSASIATGGLGSHGASPSVTSGLGAPSLPSSLTGKTSPSSPVVPPSLPSIPTVLSAGPSSPAVPPGLPSSSSGGLGSPPMPPGNSNQPPVPPTLGSPSGPPVPPGGLGSPPSPSANQPPGGPIDYTLWLHQILLELQEQTDLLTPTAQPAGASSPSGGAGGQKGARDPFGAGLGLFASGVGALGGLGAGVSGDLGPLSVGFAGMKSFAAGLSAIGAVAGPAGPALKAVADGIGMVTGVAQELTQQVVGLAKHANLAAAARWDRAIADFQAVIGHKLTPVLDLFTEGVRFTADALANILPSSSEIRAALNELRPALNDFKDLIREMIPLMREAASLNLDALRGTLQVMNAINRTTIGLLRPLGQLAGMLGLAPAGNLSSMGAAPGPARYLGLEDIGSGAALAALSMGSEPSVEQQQVSWLERIYQQIDRVIQLMPRNPIEQAQQAGRDARGWFDNIVNQWRNP